MKANQITFIGVSIIAIGGIFGAIFGVTRTYINNQREQRIINSYNSCMSDVTTSGQLYFLQRKAGEFAEATKTLKICLSRYGISEPNESLIRQFQY